MNKIEAILRGGMSKAVPSLLLVGIKQEETSTEEDREQVADKVIKTIRASCLYWLQRPCGWHTPQHEIGSTESDCTSSGDELQRPPSPTSSTSSNEAKIPLLSPSAAPTVSTDQLNVANGLSSYTGVPTIGIVIKPNSSEITYPKSEKEDPSCIKRTEKSEGERHLKWQCNECEICGKGFSKTGNMNAHIQTVHKALRPFAWDLCGRNFARMSHKKSHINLVHKNLREFVCEFCGKAFGRPSNMNNHIKAIHRELRDFACEFCGKAFPQNSELQRHTKAVHKDLREFICEFCGRAFAVGSNLKRHIRSVHGESTQM